MLHVQTKNEIRSLLDAAGIRPRQRLGQNFLIDGNLMRRLVASAGIEPKDAVLEVGGGTGSLTALLAASAGTVVCVEIDRNLHAQLGVRFASSPNVTLLGTDALAGKNHLAPELSEALRRVTAEHGTGFPPVESQVTNLCRSRAMLVANLPYQIATPLVGNILLDLPEIRRLCFTVQSEVGQRMTAAPGGRAYGPISVLVQAMCQVRRIAQVPPDAFWPQPKVESVMLRLDVGEPPFPTPTELRSFVSFVRGLFKHRRKTLRWALRRRFPGPRNALQVEGLDLSRRPQTLSVDEWMGLFTQTAGCEPGKGAGIDA